MMRCRKCTDLPLAISAPQVVRIRDHIYVGGGFRKPGDRKTIFRYNIKKNTWKPLPPCPTQQHALATLNNQLVVIGGTLLGAPSGEKTNIVLTFKEGGWTNQLPVMPTPRCLLSAMSHENRLIIAVGGIVGTKKDGECSRTDIVEIFIRKQQWYRTKRLPFPAYSLSTCIMGNTCYALGGVGTRRQSCTMLCATIASLLEKAEPAESDYMPLRCSSTWSELQGRHPLPSSALVEVDRWLMALGGEKWNALSAHGTPFISIYDFERDEWVECQGVELPEAVYRPGVAKLDFDEVMVIGGETKMQEFSSSAFIVESLGLIQLQNHYEVVRR